MLRDLLEQTAKTGEVEDLRTSWAPVADIPVPAQATPPTPAATSPTVEAEAQARVGAASADVQRFIQGVVAAAIEQRASDIHFEPLRTEYNIRFRVDGVLVHFTRRPGTEYSNLVNAIKVLAEMNITVRSVPQEGHLEFMMEAQSERTDRDSTADQRRAQVLSPDDSKRYYDIRASVMPTENGEVVVLRILHRGTALRTLNELGMDLSSLEKVRSVLLSAYGMILVTGPTGSGKTTTLYSVLQELKSPQRNIITLEDPVEFHLDWLRQCEIRESRELTYERALRSVLRQDPDVLMIGEIRDPSTAEYAIRTALAGRLVCSSLHANTTIGTFARLFELGVSRSLVGHAVNCVVAQRLVRKLCSACKHEYQPQRLLLEHFGLTEQGPYFTADGCEACEHTGFSERVGLYSVFVMDDELRTMIYDERPLHDVQTYALEHGMKTLRMDAVSKLMLGVTSLEEAARVA